MADKLSCMSLDEWAEFLINAQLNMNRNSSPSQLASVNDEEFPFEFRKLNGEKVFPFELANANGIECEIEN
jgi:hypothetical protein